MKLEENEHLLEASSSTSRWSRSLLKLTHTHTHTLACHELMRRKTDRTRRDKDGTYQPCEYA